ncbi:serine/threonine-protein kinase 2 [BeAn 58058 virus]|uniref:serine/threonine-protein kinase 2 n=1 Tax=BeAn 58058 virus TaxID=67082 RepID=UPI000909415A|nr:serine/threonine-protein kinase 2 [BeAn 58058 virus]APG58231.1 serine/threonine-protein kinase 2 [BeAn 58058 virus]
MGVYSDEIKYDCFNDTDNVTTTLGDDIYFDYVMSQLDMNQFWSTNSKLIKYFKKFDTNLFDNIIKTQYTNTSYFQQYDSRFYPSNDDFYHISTGGYGIVFKIDRYVVKFVYEQNKQYTPIEATAEYTIPRFLYNNLKGDEKEFIVCALAMGLNYKLTFLYNLYKRVLYMLILILQIMDGNKLNIYNFSNKYFLKSFNEKKNNIKFIKLVSYFYPIIIQSNINVINHFTHMFHFFEHEKRSNYLYDRGNVIIFALAKYSADKVDDRKARELGFTSIIQYVKFVFLQIALLYIKIYEMPCCSNFLHVDLKPDNILIFDSDRKLTIRFKNTEYVFNEPIKACLNDFDFSQVSNITNKKIKNSLKVEHNWYYDFHFFIHTIFKTFPEIENDKEFSDALDEFIMCCNKNICNKFRLNVSMLHPISFLEKFVTKNIFSFWINGDENAN